MCAFVNPCVASADQSDSFQATFPATEALLLLSLWTQPGQLQQSWGPSSDATFSKSPSPALQPRDSEPHRSECLLWLWSCFYQMLSSLSVHRRGRHVAVQSQPVLPAGLLQSLLCWLWRCQLSRLGGPQDGATADGAAERRPEAHGSAAQGLRQLPTPELGEPWASDDSPGGSALRH